MAHTCAAGIVRSTAVCSRFSLAGMAAATAAAPLSGRTTGAGAAACQWQLAAGLVLTRNPDQQREQQVDHNLHATRQGSRQVEGGRVEQKVTAEQSQLLPSGMYCAVLTGRRVGRRQHMHKHATSSWRSWLPLAKCTAAWTAGTRDAYPRVARILVDEHGQRRQEDGHNDEALCAV